MPAHETLRVLEHEIREKARIYRTYGPTCQCDYPWHAEEYEAWANRLREAAEAVRAEPPDQRDWERIAKEASAKHRNWAAKATILRDALVAFTDEDSFSAPIVEAATKALKVYDDAWEGRADPPPAEPTLSRAEWLTAHVDKGHSIVKHADYDACSCGATFARGSLIGRADPPPVSPSGFDWREIAHDGYPQDGQQVLVWRAWPGDIRETRFLNLRMPGPSWEGLYGWEPTHWHPMPQAPVARDRSAARSKQEPT
jgi:hypothetical protein